MIFFIYFFFKKKKRKCGICSFYCMRLYCVLLEPILIYTRSRDISVDSNFAFRDWLILEIMLGKYVIS